MQGTTKTKEQLLQELAELRQRVAKLEAAQKAFRRKLELEEVVARVSSRFVNFSNIRDAINDTLAEIGAVTGAGRAYVFLFRDGLTMMDNTHEWCAKGVSPQIDNLQNMPCDMFPWWMTKLRNGEVIHITDVSRLPVEATAEKQTLESQDIKSLLVLPLYVGGELGGFIGFDNVVSTGEWGSDDLMLLRVTSEVIGNALARVRAEEALMNHQKQLEQQVKERSADLHEALEKLRQSEIRYRTILEETGDGYFETDLSGNFILANDAMCRLIGYSKEELVGMNYRVFTPEENVRAAFEAYNRVYRTGQPLRDFLYEIIRKDGSRRFVENTVFPIKSENGEVIGFRGISRDVTERKRGEEERKQLEQRAYLASRLASIGEMASGIAHEVNNPLTGVIGYAQLLLGRQDLPDDVKHDLQVINEGAQRVADILKRMLTFARQRKPERKYVDINEILDNTIYLRAYHLKSSNIEVTTHFDCDLPMTMADAGQLQQVFLNLIINAETEMKLARGGGKLLIKTERVDNVIRISFKDNGPGIAKENLERIFEPFFTTREVGQGTGLGLSVCHGIVTEHKGRIYAKSKPGKGATFIVELPVVAEPKELELPEPKVEEPQKATKARILVVDDEPVIREFMSQVLTKEGHEVDAVGSAEDALEMIKGKRYRLIVLDIKMPGISGIELYKQLQEIASSLAQRVVFVTGDVIGTRTTAFLAKTKAPYITKPFDATRFKAEINRILTQSV